VRWEQDLLDWYSLYESKTFNKKALHFSAPLFIEATEFGDLLVTADAPFAQGIEYPHEDDYTTLDCGQTHVFPLYMSIEKEPVKQPHFPPPPRGTSPNVNVYTQECKDVTCGMCHQELAMKFLLRTAGAESGPTAARSVWKVTSSTTSARDTRTTAHAPAHATNVAHFLIFLRQTTHRPGERGAHRRDLQPELGTSARQ
jgi:hypothetical protein